ncbi:hypothetical protein [Macrococcus carouselicus]|uniref:Spore coat protein n=1 Tax=Macrococcus carouselicus TaxID=69969 RepID=A0A9Q8CJB2_9STAP|nr:hypothetical protein [Macrococcus carouselicus]TDM03700.1 hypothetical protein ERX40_00615 [Macrococcus carouselicus]
MRLIKVNQCYTYKTYGRLSDWELLNKFNPYLISSKIAMLEEQIESMYGLNVSHSESTVYGFMSVSYPLDKLAIWIIEQKDALERYRKKSSHHMQLLKQVMATYSPKEQQQIKRYMRSQGTYRPAEVVERLQVDLYQLVQNERVERNRQRENARQRARNEHVTMIKLSRQVTTV